MYRRLGSPVLNGDYHGKLYNPPYYDFFAPLEGILRLDHEKYYLVFINTPH